MIELIRKLVELLKEQKRLDFEFNGKKYRLVVTKAGKLILN